MKKTAIEQIVKAAGGTLAAEGSEKFITGIKHDSREIRPGEMFVAVKGDNHDGHRFIPQVIEAGCAAVLVSDTDQCPANADVSVILVDDTIEAMGKIASWYLDSQEIRCVAVTGSVGKTSTRDMIYYVLSQKFRCGRNLKNYNNNIGLPISVFHFAEDTEAAVLEMGMDAFGEIEYLSGIVRPEIGVITNIGIAHMEKLGSREGIFRAKMEITKNIRPASEGGALVFAGDEEFLTKERTAGDYDQIEVGASCGADLRISDVEDHGIEGISFILVYDEDGNTNRTKVELPAAGAHNAINAGLALAVGRKMGISIPEGIEGLKNVELTGSRLRKIEGASVRIIDDTYNANPDSMINAVDILNMYKKEKKTRSIAVLADMLELGEASKKLHFALGEHVAKTNVDILGTVGKEAKSISDGIKKHNKNVITQSFANNVDAFHFLKDNLKSGDTVLFKGSRGMHIDEIIEKLLNR